MKLVIVGAGDIGKNTLAAVLRTFPKNQNLDIIFLNRSFNKAQAAFLDAEIAENEYDIFEDSQNVNSQMKVKISSDNYDVSNADIIIFTAGVTASSIGSTRREDALPFVDKMINSFANEVKRYAPNALILTITNPSDIATWMMQEATGFPPERVLGFGCELDARRFIKALKKELERIGIKPKQINADVIGGHSEKNMIIPEQSIRIDGMMLSDFKAKHSQQCEEIDLAIKNADQIMRREGFEIVKMGGKTSLAPTILLAGVAKAFLFGGQIRTTCAQVLTTTRSYEGIYDSCISVPLLVDKGMVAIDSRYQINQQEIEALKNVGKVHNNLFENIKSMPNELVAEFEKSLLKLKEQVHIGAIKAGKMDAEIKLFDQNTQNLITIFTTIAQEGYSKLKVKIKDQFDKLMPLEDKTLLLNATYEFFKLRNPQIEVEVSSDKQYLLVPNKAETISFLQEIGFKKIGFKNIENSQSQSKL